MANEQDKLLLDEMAKILMKQYCVPMSVLKELLAKVKARGYVKLDVDKLTVIDDEEIDQVRYNGQFYGGAYNKVKKLTAKAQLQHTKNQLKERLTGGER